MLATLTGVTSIAGCNVFVCEYGCPHSDYRVDITVTDEAGKPVKGIRASRWGGDQNPLYTDDKGNAKDTLPGTFLQYFLEDVDGDANGGKFAPDTLYQTDFEFEQVKNGDGKWYEGVYDVKATVKLKKEK